MVTRRRALPGYRDDAKAFAVGGLLGFGGLSFGVSYNDFKGPTELEEGELVSLGLTYGFGPANVSVGYEHDWNENIDNADIFVVSGDVGLLPGVTLKGDVSYNTDDRVQVSGRRRNSTDQRGNHRPASWRCSSTTERRPAGRILPAQGAARASPPLFIVARGGAARPLPPLSIVD